MRAGVLALVAVAILGAPPASAYPAPTSGVEIVVTSLGGGNAPRRFGSRFASRMFIPRLPEPLRC